MYSRVGIWTQGCLTTDLSCNLANNLIVDALFSRARKGHHLCSLFFTNAVSFLGQWRQDEFVSFSWLNLLASLCLHTYIHQLPPWCPQWAPENKSVGQVRLVLWEHFAPLLGLLSSLRHQPQGRASLFLALQCYLLKCDFSSLLTLRAQILQLAIIVF